MIHIDITPETRAQLERDKKRSMISSVGISIGVITLIFLLMSAFVLKMQQPNPVDIVTYISPKTEVIDPTPPEINRDRLTKPSPPSNRTAPVIASTKMSDISIPVPDVDVTSPSLEFGDGNGFGTGGLGSNDGFGPGSKFKLVPNTMRSRCDAEDRMKRLLESGGTKEGEAAVVKALDFLQKTQNSDGSWDSQHPVAMTGLALLAYLGHCETPDSKKYGDTVLKAIVYLTNVGMKNDNRLTNKPAESIQWVYDHGIATYALAEAYTFCSKTDSNIPDLDKVVIGAGERIMKGQAPAGGWSYKFAPSPVGDNSVGYWQIQAMKACKLTGLWKDSEFTEHSRLALDWLESAQGPDGAIGYRNDSKRSPGLTGGGVLAFQMWNKGLDKTVRDGVKWIDKNTKFEWGKESANLYYHYYTIQAMLNHGGEEWAAYNTMVRDPLISAQNADGSWSQKMTHGPINDHMATCLAALSLETYYRFLPTAGK